MGRKILYFAVLVATFAAAGAYIMRNSDAKFQYSSENDIEVIERERGPKTALISLANKSYSALVSDTEMLRGRGLSGAEQLKDDEAMLFVFPNAGMWGIWMKDMNFSIDIVWLGSDRKVISIEKSVSPETYPKIFFPKSASSYVIELPAGTVAKENLKIGDVVSIEGLDTESI